MTPHRPCATCGDEFLLRANHSEQLTCSRRCGAIWRAKHLPHTVSMQQANRVRRQQYVDQLEVMLAGKSLAEAFLLGDQRGYGRARQQQRRATRS
jgi:hypothetical protein